MIQEKVEKRKSRERKGEDAYKNGRRARVNFRRLPVISLSLFGRCSRFGNDRRSGQTGAFPPHLHWRTTDTMDPINLQNSQQLAKSTRSRLRHTIFVSDFRGMDLIE